MFIKLHSLHGNANYMNVDHIECITPKGTGSVLYIADPDVTYEVTETPEEVVTLINRKEAHKFGIIKDIIVETMKYGCLNVKEALE